MSPLRCLILALLTALGAGCWDREPTNPYDPEARDTVAGQLRITFDLPASVVGDELADPRVRAAALDELHAVAVPLTTVGAYPATAQSDGTLTITAPAGRYTVTTTHRRGVFETSTHTIELTLAERRDLVVALRRAALTLSVRFKFGTAPEAPLGAWVELRWLPAGETDCLIAVPIRRFDVSHRDALNETLARPISRQICALVGAPGFETLTVSPILVDGPTLDLGFLTPTPAPASVGLLGLPEARQLEDGTIRTSARVGGRLVLLHLRLTPGQIDDPLAPRAGLSFDPSANAEQRVRRIAIADGAVGQDTVPAERFARIDRLPFEGSGESALPFIGAIPPSQCAHFDETSRELNELLVQSAELQAQLARRQRAGDPNGHPTERLLPYCLLGDEADTRELTVALETEGGAIHRIQTQFQVDRRAPSRVGIEVYEDRPAIDGDINRRRSVPPWRGRYQVHAASQVQVIVEELSPDPFEVQITGLNWRVAYVVQSGERYDGGWTFRPCPDPLLVDFDAVAPEDVVPAPATDAGPASDAGIDLDAALDPAPDAALDPAPDAALDPDADAPLAQPPPATGRGVRSGAVASRISLPVPLVGPVEPETGHDGAFRMHRNRVCLYIEDAAGNLREDAIDIEVFAGTVQGILRAGASAEDDTPRWVGVDCPITFPDDACPGFHDPLLISDKIVFQSHVVPESVDRTVNDASLIDGRETFGLRQVTITIDADSHPQPFRQDRRLVHNFDEDGPHHLQVTGIDLLGRAVPFIYGTGPEARAQIRFLRDTRPPSTLARAFLTCTACATAVRPCCEPPSATGQCLITVDDPCLGCVTDDFVIADNILVAPASAEVPVRFAFDFDFPSPAENLCVVTQRVGEETRGFSGLCTNAGTLPALAPDDATLVETGTTVRYKTDIYDAACNRDLDPGALSVLYDPAPPRILADATGKPAVQIACRTLDEICNGPRTCWRVRQGRDACDLGGLRVLENIALTLSDPASAHLGGPVIRYRLVLSEDTDPPPLTSICGEAPWRVTEAPDDAEPRRRRAICTPTATCGCIYSDQTPQLRPPVDGAALPTLPLAIYRNDRLIKLDLAAFDDPDARIIRGRLYLAAEDAVGNVAVVPLSDDRCVDPEDCAAFADRFYEVPVRPIDLPGDDLPDPPWHEVRDCEPQGDTGVSAPVGDSYGVIPLANALCQDGQ